VQVISTAPEAEEVQVKDDAQVAYVTQTTLSVDDTREVIEILKRRFPAIRGPELKDICYATQNRQNAVRDLLVNAERLIVVGSANSSNSNRLKEMGERSGCPSYLVDDASQLEPAWFEGVSRVGVTAGASAPENLVAEIVARLRELGVKSVSEMDGEVENTVFKMPAELE